MFCQLVHPQWSSCCSLLTLRPQTPCWPLLLSDPPVVSRHLSSIAADLVQPLQRRDPSGTMIAFYDMMKKTIVMPAHLMEDGKHVRPASASCCPCQSCFLAA